MMGLGGDKADRTAELWSEHTLYITNRQITNRQLALAVLTFLLFRPIRFHRLSQSGKFHDRKL